MSDTATSTRATALPAGERRASIVAAVIPLLVDHGEAVTTRQIAEAAGVAEGTIFRVFPDKDAVIAAAIDTVLDPEPLEVALGEIDETLALHDRLVAVVTVVQERVVNVWQLLSAVGPRHADAGGRPMTPSPTLERLLQAGELRMPAADAAHVLRSMTLALTHPMLAPTPMAATDIVDLFLHGAQERSSC